MTGFTAPAFTALLPPCEQALAASLQDRTLDGHPRPSRRYRADDHCPCPTRADKRLFSLTYVTPHPRQEVQGPLCGRSPANANQWRPLLQAVLNQA
jgi:hypothetical protein